MLILFGGAILWANLFGLPRFVTARVKEELRQQSIALDFARLRLKGLRRLVAEEVHLESLSTPDAPRLQVTEAEILIRYSRLASGEIDLSGLRLKNGVLRVPVSTNESLSVSNINTELRFLPGDALRLLNFSAETLGAKTSISGDLRSVSKFRFGGGGGDGQRVDWQRPLEEVVRIADELEFQSPPELKLSFSADGADLTGTRISVELHSGPASSKWGTLERLRLNSAIYPVATNNSVRGTFESEVAGFRSEAGRIEHLQLDGGTLWVRSMEQLLTNYITFNARGVDSPWFYSESAAAWLASWQETQQTPLRSTLELVTGASEAGGARIATNVLRANLVHPLPFPTPAWWLGQFIARSPSGPAGTRTNNLVEGDWRWESSGLSTRNARIGSIQLVGTLSTAAAKPTSPELSYWRTLGRIEAPWQMLVTNIQAGEIDIGSIQTRGNWSFPILQLAEFDAHLYGGYLKGSGKLDVQSRIVTASGQGDFAYHEVAFLLDAPVQRWLSDFAWKDPPFVESTVQFQLPEWTSEWDEPSHKILPTLQISGRFDGAGAFRGIQAERATSHFRFTNFVWNLPNLVITRPEGQALVGYTGNVTNGDFHVKLESQINPAALKPLFPEEEQAAFEFVKFATPPLVQAEGWGNLDDPSRLGVIGSLAATNFFIKEQAFGDIRAGFWITNGLIHLTNLVAHRGQEELRAPFARIDLPGEVMFVTNAISTMDPYIAMSLVGEDAYDAIDPYRFAVTPTVRINGLVPLRHWSKADLRFAVAGTEFSFWRFHLPSLVGEVHWKADHISFSNVTASFYGGQAHWSGYFVIDHQDDSANFSFTGSTTNTELKYLVADLAGVTNHLAGTLSGQLVITSANSERPDSWNGYGAATLTDGFLWNVPVFGIFSPILDGIAPGLGSSPVSSGTGTFTIRNSVVHTRDMQVRAPTFRLNYKGQVDLEGRLNALVEAEILRDTWVVGKLFSMALWPVSKAFEARVSGTLTEPKTDLRFFPKFLLAPFRLFTPRAQPGTAGAETEKPGAAPPAK